MSLSCYNSWINVICYDKFKFVLHVYHSHLVVKKNKSFNFLFGADMAVPVSDSSVVAHHPLYQTHAGLEPAICWIKKKRRHLVTQAKHPMFLLNVMELKTALINFFTTVSY